MADLLVRVTANISDVIGRRFEKVEIGCRFEAERRPESYIYILHNMFHTTIHCDIAYQ
jgi:hypothetical protein